MISVSKLVIRQLQLSDSGAHEVKAAVLKRFSDNPQLKNYLLDKSVGFRKRFLTIDEKELSNFHLHHQLRHSSSIKSTSFEKVI
jgi:hypothetical protein